MPDHSIRVTDLEHSAGPEVRAEEKTASGRGHRSKVVEYLAFLVVLEALVLNIDQGLKRRMAAEFIADFFPGHRFHRVSFTFPTGATTPDTIGFSFIAFDPANSGRSI